MSILTSLTESTKKEAVRGDNWNNWIQKVNNTAIRLLTRNKSSFSNKKRCCSTNNVTIGPNAIAYNDWRSLTRNSSFKCWMRWLIITGQQENMQCFDDGRADIFIFMPATVDNEYVVARGRGKLPPRPSQHTYSAIMFEPQTYNLFIGLWFEPLQPKKVKSNYFRVRPKVDQRAGLLSLPKFPPYCNVHHICLYLVSIHQRATPLLNSATLLARLLDYYSITDPKGMKGWVGLVGWPIADALPTKWSHVNHGSGKA